MSDAGDRPGRERLAKRRFLRPPGLVVFAVLVLLVGAAWWLYADGLVERGVEKTGASLTGARVDVASAAVRPTEGSVSIRGLQVANPDHPMRNLFEAEEITADLMLAPLLEKKVVIERLAVRGVRFDTQRETSGALDNPDPQAGQLWRNVNAWADQIRIPELSLESLGGTIRTEAIAADSLATVQYARRAITRADSMRTSWETRLGALDPRPRIDSLRSVVQRVEGFQLTPLNATQLPGLLRDGRNALQNLRSLETEVQALDESVQEGLSSLAFNQETLSELRERDMAYARGLLDIPTLDAPTISPALFGGTALTWLKPVLFWARRAEQFLPPGLDPRRRPGPSRARAEGTTYDFREGAEWPSFLLQQGELDMILDGTGPAAGAYSARIRDLTTAPALLGRPMEIALGREQGAQGPGRVSLLAVLDHTGEILRDSVDFVISGFGLPRIPVESFGGRLDLGQGQATFSASRMGDGITARMRWVTDDVSWVASLGEEAAGAGARAGDTTAPPTDSAAAARTRASTRPSLEGALQQIRGEIGSSEWARSMITRTLAGLERVELEMSLGGSLQNPQLSVSSNLGAAVAQALRRELGREVDAAEQRVRAEVNAQIQPLVADARSRIDALRTELGERVGAQRAEVEGLRARLEERIGQLTGENLRLP